MATRSLIGRSNDDGTVTAVYCHWDGYIEEPGVGWTLNTYWKDRAKVDAMMELGDLSSLGHEIGEKHAFNADTDNIGYACTFYGRDRGETGVGAREFPSAEAYWSQWQQTDAEFQYLFYHGEWMVKPRNRPVQQLAKHYALKAA